MPLVRIVQQCLAAGWMVLRSFEPYSQLKYFCVQIEC